MNFSKLKQAAKKGGGEAPPAVLSNKPGRPIFTSSGAVFPYSNELADAFSHKDRFKEPYINYKVIAKATKHARIMLPRAKFPLGVEDRREYGEAIDVQMHMPPRNDEQVRVCQELDDHYEDGRTGIIVNASTGFGKTYVGCHAVANRKRTTLVLITKSDLEDQWYRSFRDFLQLEDEDIGLIKADVFNVMNKKVVIGYVQSLMKDDRYPSWIYKHFGMLIPDEVHLMAADVFVNAMWLLPAVYRLGLSATIDRSDRKEHVFKDHIGRTLITADLLPMPFNVIVVDTKVKVPKHVKYRAGRTMALNNFLGLHKHRQAMITAKIVKAYKADRNIVAMADTIEHLDYAYDCLVDAGVKIKDIGWYVGHKGKITDQMKEELRGQAFKKIVLATYKMTGYGTDFPHWDTIFMMTPRADVRQPVGRVTRELEGKKIPLVYDFVDPIRLLISYFHKRLLWYVEKADKIIGAKI